MRALAAKATSYCSYRRAVGRASYLVRPVHSPPHMSSIAGSVAAITALRSRELITFESVQFACPFHPS